MFSLRTLGVALIAAVTISASAATLDDEMRAVERIRGVKFTAPVKVVTLDRDQVPQRLREQFTKTLPYSTDQWALILRALHLADGDGQKLLSSLLNLYESQVLAFYDPLTHTYYALRDLPDAAKSLDTSTALEESVALHELTHALQDQRFDIGEKDLALIADSDASFALHAVAEGEATLVMMAWMADQGGSSLDDLVKSDAFVDSIAAAASRTDAMGEGVPRYFIEMMKFPYIDGLRFVVEAYRHGGWKGVDSLWSDPPRSTREILHPDDYFTTRFHGQRFIAKPPFRVSKLLSVEHLGEFHWAFLAGAENARGWSGDRVTVAADAAHRTTVLVETEWDTPAQARRFRDAYLKFLGEHGESADGRIAARSVAIGYGADRNLIRRFLKR